jgi:hypothetical protein
MQSAVIYARVSSREQEREGYSIPAQRKLLAEYARLRGFRVQHEFIDVESAKKPWPQGIRRDAAPIAIRSAVPGRTCRKNGPALPKPHRQHRI